MAILSGFNRRRKFTVDSSKIDSSLTKFPHILHINASAGISDKDITSIFDILGSDANRKRIAITAQDGITQLKAELILYSTTEQQAFIAIAPNVNSSTDDFYYLNYDPAAPNNTTFIGDTGESSAKSIWDSDFLAVLHMTQDPSGGVGSMKDSTVNANHGTPEASMGLGNLVDGLTGKAIDFNGTSDDIDISTIINDISALTRGCVEGTIYPRVDSTDKPWVSFSKDTSDLDYIWLHNFRVEHRDNWDGGYPGVNLNQWNYVGLNHDGSDLDLIVNGAPEIFTYSLTTDKTAWWAALTGMNKAYIGRMERATSDFRFNGMVDALRISKEPRSVAWRKATFYSNTDNLITWGEEEVFQTDSKIGKGIDLALEQIDGVFDVSIDLATGDFKLVDGFETALTMSLFCERRADESEVPTAELRRGWWGNEVGPEGFEIGSKLWLLDQSRKLQKTLNDTIDFARDGTKWFIDDGHLVSIDITSGFNNGLNLDLKLNRSNSATESFSYELWENTNAV